MTTYYKILLSMVITFSMLYPFPLEAKQTGIFTTIMMFKGEMRNVFFYVPEDYDENKPYPLVVGMQSYYTSPVAMRLQVLGAAKEFKFILACPSDPLYCGDILPDCIEFCKSEYNIDTTNIVITGAGEGGTTAFVWGAANPWKVKGVIGYAAMIAAVDYTMVNNRAFAGIRGTLDGQSSGTKPVLQTIKQNGGESLYIEKENVRNEMHPYYHSPDFDKDYKECYRFIQNFQPRPQVKLISPANTIYAPEEPVLLKWNSIPGAVGYEVIIKKLINTVITDTTNDTTYVLPKLDSGEYYWWRVRHLNNDTAGEYSHKWSFRTRISVPGKPVLSIPANGQKDITVYTSYGCQYTPRSDYYHFQVSSDNFGTTIIDDSNYISGTSEVVYSSTKKLDYSTTYNWRVRAGNDEGWGPWSDVYTFTTYITGLVLVAPDSNTTGVAASGKLLWQKINNTATYKVQLSKSREFLKNVIDKFNVTDTSVEFSNLEKNTKYYWRVKAITNGGVEGKWSNIWSFTTEALLSAPVLISPSNNLKDSPDSVEFSWQKISNVTSYTFQLSQTDNFGNIEIEQQEITDTFYYQSNLLKNTKYYWRVKGFTETNETYWSPVWNFTTEKVPQLDAPILISPANNAKNHPINGILTWSSKPGASSYDVQLATNLSFSDIIFHCQGITSNKFAFDSLLEGKTYYWRVRAINEGLISPWSEVWNFSTVMPLLPPEIRYLKNDDINIPVNGRFIWTEIQGADSYRLQLSNSPDFSLSEKYKYDNPMNDSNMVIDDSGITNNYYDYANLVNNTKYWLRLNQKQGARESNWSNPLCFTTATLTDVNENISKSQIELFSYPNPANNQVFLEFNLLSDAKVSLKLYNILGVEVESLLAGINLDEGIYNILLDVRDKPSGLYIVQLQTDGVVKYLMLTVE